MKVVLIFPPGWTLLNGPHCGLPSITSYLRKRDIQVSQRDCNIEMYDSLLSKRVFEEVSKRLEAKLQSLDKRKFLDRTDKEIYYKLAFLSQKSDFIGRNVDFSKKMIRDRKSFYDYDLYKKSCFTLFQGCNLLNQLSVQKPLWDAPKLKRPYLELEFGLFDKYLREVVVPSVLKEGADLVGLSVACEEQLNFALLISKFLKQKSASTKICLGGTFVTNMVSALGQGQIRKLFFRFADFVITDEGETALHRLLTALSEKGNSLKASSIAPVPNLVYMKDGRIARTDAHVEQIDSLPTPDFDGLPLKRYHTPNLILPLLTSRGCYWGKCAFCSHSFLFKSSYRARGIALLGNDLERLASKYRTNLFYFSDEAIHFTRMRRIAGMIINSKRDLCWACYGRLDSPIDGQTAKHLFQGGCRKIFFGLESGCSRVLELIEKGIKLQNARTILRSLFQADISFDLSWIIGFPSETKGEAKETLSFMLDNIDYLTFFNKSVGHRLYVPIQSKFHRQPQRYGIERLHPGEDYFWSFNFVPLLYDVDETFIGFQNSLTRNLGPQFFGDTLFNFLYVCHHGSDWVPSSPTGEDQLRRRILGGKVFRLDHNMTARPRGFNIEDCLAPRRRAVPRKTVTIYNYDERGAKEHFVAVSRDVMDIISCCDGTHTGQQLISLIAERSGLSASEVREPLLNTLTTLLKSGILRAGE